MTAPTGAPVARESRLGRAMSWLSLLAAFALSFGTWVDLARLAHYGALVSYALPVALDGYLCVALVAWMAPVSSRVARHARANTYGAALVGVVAQSWWHAASVTGPTWRHVLAALVGALAPLVGALGVHLRAMAWRDMTAARQTRQPVATGDSAPVHAVATVGAPVSPVATDATALSPLSRHAVASVAPVATPVTPAPTVATGATAWRTGARDTTDRERAMALLALGNSARQVAQETGLSLRSVQRLAALRRAAAAG